MMSGSCHLRYRLFRRVTFHDANGSSRRRGLGIVEELRVEHVVVRDLAERRTNNACVGIEVLNSPLEAFGIIVPVMKDLSVCGSL